MPNRLDHVPQEWLTRFELSDQRESPRYDETMEYFHKFATSSPYAKMFSFGVSPQGRDLNYLVIANGSEFAPQQAHTSWKTIVLIQNGIHAGEIEGKDACMMLLRDILVTKEKEHLLEKLILIVIPILNIDGHERISPTNRPNQNGPVEMGWRTTSHNLNLNRDYMKAEAPEMQALLKLYSSWLPDFLIDNHTTNGGDYQYHVTYGLEQHQNIDAELASWGNRNFLPEISRRVEEQGFLTAPYMDVDGDIREGFALEPSMPRYSTGYAAVQNRLCLLVETHSLKPFGNRVYSTKATNDAVLEYLCTTGDRLRKLNNEADTRSVEMFCSRHLTLPVAFETLKESRPFLFKGFEQREEQSPLTGAPVIIYSSTPKEFEIPLFDRTAVTRSVILPIAYCIPEEFGFLAGKLELHGIEVESLSADLECAVERYRFEDVVFAKRPYEGRQRVDCSTETFEQDVLLRRGTYVVVAMQRSVRVIAHLLEPDSPDSLLRWGFFNAFFERKEYAEPYIMEPIASEMIRKNKTLREDFYTKLDQDESFRNDPDARLDYFYQRSPYVDVAENVYPIMRIIDPRVFARLSHSLS